MTRDPERLRAFAEHYTAAWCSMDPARVSALYAPGGSLTINDGPPAIGRTAITEAARGFYVALPDMQVFMDEGLIAASLGHYDQTEYARQLEHGVGGRDERGEEPA